MECFKIIKPVAPLFQFIRHYWFLHIRENINQKYFCQVIPKGSFELVINYRANYFENSKNENEKINPTSLIGPFVKYKNFGVRGKVGVFGIVFNPHGFYLLNNINTEFLARKYTPIENISYELKEFKNRLLHAKDNRERIEFSNAFFLNQYSKREKYIKDVKIPFDSIINKIKSLDGCVNINELAEMCFCSLSKFERNFKEVVGITPKQYAKIIRFNHALTIFNRNYNNGYDFIYKIGYYDQSHFINEFKKFMDITPNKYLQLRKRIDENYYLTKIEFNRFNKKELIY